MAESGPVEWNSHIEAYYEAWRSQIKLSEFDHLQAREFYTRLHLIGGSIGALSVVGGLFTQTSGLVSGAAADMGNSSCVTVAATAVCTAGTACFGLKMAGVVLTAVVAASLMLLLVHKPAAIAEQHLTAANAFNRICREIDLTLLRERHLREPFWSFTKQIIEEYERLVKEVGSGRWAQ